MDAPEFARRHFDRMAWDNACAAVGINDEAQAMKLRMVRDMSAKGLGGDALLRAVGLAPEIATRWVDIHPLPYEVRTTRQDGIVIYATTIGGVEHTVSEPEIETSQPSGVIDGLKDALLYARGDLTKGTSHVVQVPTAKEED
jgi:hypothetical protein